MAVAERLEAEMRRRAIPHAERGAAVFLVVLILTLITALGVFAVRSASLADVAAGFDREGAQAALIAQYGITATAAYVGTGVSDTIIGKMKSPPDAGYIMPACESNGYPMGLPPRSPPMRCFRLTKEVLEQSFKNSSNEFVFTPSNKGVTGNTSSLNVNETTDATFSIEMTDISTTGMPLTGSGEDWVQYQVTLTSLAQVRPVAACTGTPTTIPNAAQTVVRSVITIGGPRAK
jgi:hypothetical protein